MTQIQLSGFKQILILLKQAPKRANKKKLSPSRAVEKISPKFSTGAMMVLVGFVVSFPVNSASIPLYVDVVNPDGSCPSM